MPIESIGIFVGLAAILLVAGLALKLAFRVLKVLILVALVVLVLSKIPQVKWCGWAQDILGPEKVSKVCS